LGSRRAGKEANARFGGWVLFYIWEEGMLKSNYRVLDLLYCLFYYAKMLFVPVATIYMCVLVVVAALVNWRWVCLFAACFMAVTLPCLGYVSCYFCLLFLASE
jgi:hypothetical protein